MAEPVEVFVDETPNPHALKFTLNRLVTPPGKTYRDAASADAPWAKALLGIPGVIGVFGINNFISVNKAPEADWDIIIPLAESALKTAFGSM